MKYILVPLLFVFSLIRAQEEVNSVFISDSLKKAIFLNGTRLNITEPEVWITYDLGINKNSDTLAFDRDSIFIVTWKKNEINGSQRYFSDEHGQSFFSIKEAFQKNDFLNKRGYSKQQINKVELDTMFFKVMDNRTDDMKQECECSDLVHSGAIASVIEWNGEMITLSETPFAYDAELEDGFWSLNQNIQDSIDSIKHPIIYSSDQIEFIKASFYFSGFERKICFKDEYNECQYLWSSSEGLVEINLLRKTN